MECYLDFLFFLFFGEEIIVFFFFRISNFTNRNYDNLSAE